ncbi:MAG: histidine kinase [Bacteroidia bacterium]|nr:histidine kinase [Bacteroidia bacterium]NNK70994.1 histidine kinase [Flavobacteriaceae bacterium]
MIFSSIQNPLDYPHDNGILTFTLGILFVLSIYHLLLYLQHRDKLYLLYSSYTFTIILAHLIFVDKGFINDLLEPVERIKRFRVFYTEAYYIIYFFFTMKFLDVRSEFPRWADYCYKAIYLLIVICAIFLIISLVTIDSEERSYDSQLISISYNFIFVPLMTLISIVVYVLFFKLKNKLKYYIIIGGLTLSICSYISLYHYNQLLAREEDVQAAYTLLYFAFILENILFALGLGHKQKIILSERNESQEKLILQLQENEELREKIQTQLEADVRDLSKQAESEKIKSIKMQFDKELAELKVSALRSQMNPHFIFNSLNSIKRYIIDSEKENAVYYLNKFSKLIRLILSSSREDEVSLADELETIELYVNIENIRFNNEIDFLIDITENINLDTIKIPSLILQPFIENAIWHGLSLKKTNKKLKVKVEKENKSFVKIDIIDNGIGRQRSAEIKSKKIHRQESVGIKLTQERLKNFSKNYKNAYSLSIIDLFDQDNEPSGTQITLKLPTE